LQRARYWKSASVVLAKMVLTGAQPVLAEPVALVVVAGRGRHSSVAHQANSVVMAPPMVAAVAAVAVAGPPQL
jgi:hypothetical protein